MTTDVHLPDSRLENELLWLWNEEMQWWEYRSGERWAFVRKLRQMNEFLELRVFQSETDEGVTCESQILQAKLLIARPEREDDRYRQSFEIASTFFKD